jgi:hypothetical protein
LSRSDRARLQPLHGGLDAALLNGIEAFQRTNGLAVDRVVNPGGETERTLNQALRRKAQGPAAAPAPQRTFGLRATVGRDSANVADDVQAAKRGLAWAGFYPGAAAQAPTGDADADFLRGITDFQAHHGLKQDGWMRPGGETERAIDRVIAPMILAHGMPDPRVSGQGRPLEQPAQESAGPPVESPSFAPEREPHPAPPPSFAPVRTPEPLPPLPRRESFLPPPDPADVRRNEALSRLGLPIPLSIGERLIRLRRAEATSEAEAFAGAPIPDWRDVEPAHWAMWAEGLDREPTIGPVQREVFLQIFAAEGGFQPTSDRAFATIAGVTGGEEDSAIEAFATRIGVEPNTRPRDLTISQLIAAYQAYFDDTAAFGRVGGSAVLDDIDDVPAAILIADTLFRHGTDKGPEIIQAAIDAVAPGLVDADGILGPATLDAYLALMADTSTRDLLRNAIKAGRDAHIGEDGDLDRSAYMISL